MDNKMKIGVVGNYGNNNQGDEAILEGVLIQLEKAYPVKRKDILVFTNSPEQTKEKFGVQVRKLYYKKSTAPTTLVATVLKHRPVIRELDLLIIGGGGILMDLYVHSLVLFGMYGKIAQYTKTPYVIYGAGAGPIQTLKGKIILRSLVNHAEMVTVRDEASKNVLQSIGVKREIIAIADPAFYLTPPLMEKKEEPRKTIHIGVTAVPYYHANYWPSEDRKKYNNYVTGMARNLERLLDKDPRIRVTFFSTKHPQDTAVSKDIVKQMQNKNRCMVYDERLDQQEILEKIGEQDLIIGTRLHSLILALVACKPIIAVAYHHKVEDFMKENHSQDCLLSIGSLHQKDSLFTKIYEQMAVDWEETLSRFEKITQNKTKSLPQGMDLLQEKVHLK